ncbi:hypothetical protein DY000_02016951 [Brassica cretica]|uniref:Uncharacterized protein n=1 Tax=Brassica cretica TaxID=69181 RepID=A0ABQ7D644_BRACR|nr:hypothetical protein DY000_02016951 [Brassica cretica]
MSGITKDKIAVHNNAGKTTPAAAAPMANAYANATVLEKIENLAATFHHRKCNETSSRFLFLNIKGNDKSYQTPYVWLITELKKSQRVRVLPKHVSRKLFRKVKVPLPKTAKNPRLIVEKGSTANRVHNSLLYFFRLSCGKTLC